MFAYHTKIDTFTQRKQIRLKKYDYSQSGWYFVTICTQNRENVFGNIVDGKMILNEWGMIVENIWKSLPNHHPVEWDAFQIMPNHVHFILHIVSASRPNNTGGSQSMITGASQPNNTGGACPAPTAKLGTIIGSFKSECTKQIHSVGARRAAPAGYNARPVKTIWQRNYYEHIIRNEEEYVKIKEYIKLNPSMWERDRNNQNNILL